MHDDPLSWLLPEACAEERAHLRRMVTGLRLLRDDARASTGRVAPSGARARSALEHAQRLRRRRALATLLAAYLQALRPAHSFLELGPRAPGCGEAWRAWLAEEEGGASLVPHPTEAPPSVLRRLLEAARSAGSAPGWSELWEARSRHLTAGPAEAARRWERLLARAAGAGAPPPQRARLLGGLLAAHLEQGQPERALGLFGPHAPLAALDPGLRRLFGWSALLCGELERARLWLAHGTPARLPSALDELRADVPAFAPLLLGEPESGAPADGARDARAELGMHLVAAFVCDGQGRGELVALEAPRAARAELERRLAHSPPDADDSLPAGPCRARRAAPSAAPLAHALGGSRVRALVRVGVRASAGPLAGWIQLESEHLGLPCAAQLEALARGWRAEILARRGARLVAVPRAAEVQHAPFGSDDPRAEFGAVLRARLPGLGTARARWLELAPGGTLLLRCAHGAWRTAERLEPAALRAACEQARPLTHADAHGAAFALPLPAPGAAPGLLACELTSRAALEPSLAAARALLAGLAPLWWASAFRAAWRASHGAGLAWDPGCRFLAGLEPALRGLEASASLLIVGPRGSGRRTLAGWRHFRAARGAAARARLAEMRVHELERLDAAAQRALAASEPGFSVLAEAPLCVLRASGRLEPALEQVLEPLPLCVPPLAERRDEIPGLVRALAGAVRFDDEALGALWRQDWPGEVRTLAALLAQLVRAQVCGAPIGVSEVRAALRSRGLVYRARLASRAPRALDLELALASTRHRNGAPNHARAARYLGWDTETLETRLGRGRARGGGAAGPEPRRPPGGLPG